MPYRRSSGMWALSLVGGNGAIPPRKEGVLLLMRDQRSGRTRERSTHDFPGARLRISQ